jgi:hypothetical protein
MAPALFLQRTLQQLPLENTPMHELVCPRIVSTDLALQAQTSENFLSYKSRNHQINRLQNVFPTVES